MAGAGETESSLEQPGVPAGTADLRRCTHISRAGGHLLGDRVDDRRRAWDPPWMPSKLRGEGAGDVAGWWLWGA